MKYQNFALNIKSLVQLFIPILITQLIPNLVGFFDTIMAGRVSATDLAAVAIASSIWLPISLMVHGLMMALASIVSQHSGAKAFDAITKNTQQSIWIVLFISLCCVAGFYLFIPAIVNFLQLEPQLHTLIIDYLLFIVLGMPGFCLFLVLRNCAEGLAISKPAMYISIIGLLINIPLNYVFIYGAFGIPAFGGAGCGIASAIVFYLMAFGMWFYIRKSSSFSQVRIFKYFPKPKLNEIKHILSVGVPIALSLLFEVSLFTAVAIIIAPLGADIVASHQIALNYSGVIFMIPLSFAMAVTVKVGFALGTNDAKKAEQLCKHAFLFTFGLAIFTASITLLLRDYIGSIYTNDTEVISLASQLLLLAAMFQFSDAIQVIAAGALRGYKDTKAILLITFISYWSIGLTLGYLLGMTDIITPRMGPAGFWIGFIAGLSAAAVLLFYRLKVIQKRVALNH